MPRRALVLGLFLLGPAVAHAARPGGVLTLTQAVFGWALAGRA